MFRKQNLVSTALSGFLRLSIALTPRHATVGHLDPFPSRSYTTTPFLLSCTRLRSAEYKVSRFFALSALLPSTQLGRWSEGSPALGPVLQDLLATKRGRDYKENIHDWYLSRDPHMPITSSGLAFLSKLVPKVQKFPYRVEGPSSVATGWQLSSSRHSMRWSLSCRTISFTSFPRPLAAIPLPLRKSTTSTLLLSPVSFSRRISSSSSFRSPARIDMAPVETSSRLAQLRTLMKEKLGRLR